MNSSYLEGEGDDEDEDDTSISLSAIKKNYKPGAKRGKDIFIPNLFFKNKSLNKNGNLKDTAK